MSPAPALPRRYALLLNVHSGSYDAETEAALVAAFASADMDLARVIHVPDDDIPDAATLARDECDGLAIYTGDGTINSAMQRLAGWDGAILTLPGGTMNFLSKNSHGDRPAAEILVDVGHARATTYRPPLIDTCAGPALVGIIAGPTTAWGDVREKLRHRDLGGLLEAVPAALERTREAPGVSLDNDDRVYQALNFTPTPDGIRVQGFLTDSAIDLMRHGVAWLSGDFREGPHDDLGLRQSLTLDGDAVIGLLIDGEAADTRCGAELRLDRAPVDFIATRRAERIEGGA